MKCWSASDFAGTTPLPTRASPTLCSTSCCDFMRWAQLKRTVARAAGAGHSLHPPHAVCSKHLSTLLACQDLQ